MKVRADDGLELVGFYAAPDEFLQVELQVARGDEETVLRLLAEAPGVSAHRENGTIVAAGAEWAAIPGLVTSLAR